MDTLPPIPELYRPFPSALNIHADRLDAALLEWLDRHGMCATAAERADWNRARWALVTSYIYPRLPFDVLEVAGMLVGWNSQFDKVGFEDQISKRNLATFGANLLRSAEVFEEPDKELNGYSDPFMSALREFAQRLRELATDEQVYRINHGMLRQFYGNASELPYELSDTPPRLRDYLLTRRYTSAVGSCYMVFIEIDGRHPLPPGLWATPNFQALSLAVDDIFGLVNDINCLQHDTATLERSTNPRRNTWNSVLIAANEFEVPLEEALRRMSELHDSRTVDFIELTKKIQAAVDVDLQDYFADLGGLLSGHHDWYAETLKYSHPE